MLKNIIAVAYEESRNSGCVNAVSEYGTYIITLRVLLFIM